MNERTIWFGPVSLAQVQQPGASLVQCTGDGSPNCGDLAEQRGRDLDALAAHLGIDDPWLVLRAFSAGGSAVKRYLAREQSRARVLAVTLHDAVYEASRGVVAPGFLAFAREAAGGDRLLVATVSSAPNGDRGSGSESLDALRAEIERETGRAFEPLSVLPGVDLEPVRAWRLGGVLFADYGSRLSHAEHATRLAPLVWSGLVEPWIADGGSDVTQSAAPLGALLAGVILGGFGLGLLALARARRRALL